VLFSFVQSRHMGKMKGWMAACALCAWAVAGCSPHMDHGGGVDLSAGGGGDDMAIPGGGSDDMAGPLVIAPADQAVSAPRGAMPKLPYPPPLPRLSTPPARPHHRPQPRPLAVR